MKRTLIALALLVTSAVFAQAPAARISEITIGTAVPSGQSFVITLDERSIDRAYPVWTRPLSGAWTTIVTKEQFRSVVRDAVRRELAATFPDGFPPDAFKEGMELEIKLSNPPEISISFGC
jgi:hypothetical protein